MVHASIELILKADEKREYLIVFIILLPAECLKWLFDWLVS